VGASHGASEVSDVSLQHCYTHCLAVCAQVRDAAAEELELLRRAQSLAGEVGCGALCLLGASPQEPPACLAPRLRLRSWHRARLHASLSRVADVLCDALLSAHARLAVLLSPLIASASYI